MIVVVAVIVVVLVIVAAVVWWVLRGRSPAGPGRTPLAELVQQAEQLPPSPTRTVVRLRVELRESTDAAEAAAVAARGSATDLTQTMARLRDASALLDADLAVLSGRADAAIGPVVPAMRSRVREVQAVADRVVVLSRDAIAGHAQSDLTRLHDELDHELRVLDAHRELDEG